MYTINMENNNTNYFVFLGSTKIKNGVDLSIVNGAYFKIVKFAVFFFHFYVS
jgi:hypothetical protein